VKAWFNSFFSLESFPLSCYPYISIAIFSQLAQCLVALYRLTTFAAPGILWDRQRVIQELDIADVIKLIGDRWERVPLAAGLETRPLQVGVREDDRWPEDPWSHTKRKVLAIGMWWEAKVAAMTGADVESENGPRSEGDRATNEPEISGQQQMDAEFRAMDMELLDDSWLRDLFVGEYDFNMAPYSEVIQ
jgi:hypothetical protein